MPHRVVQESASLLVTRDVGRLGEGEVDEALSAGVNRAQQLLAEGLIEGAALRLLGETVLVGSTGIRASALSVVRGGAPAGVARV